MLEKLEIGQTVMVHFQGTGKTVSGTIKKVLPNGVYVCRISKDTKEEDPGQEFRVILNDLNEMVVLKK